MNEKIKKILLEQFNSLPESIKDIILSSNYEETLLVVGKQYQLDTEQIAILERETTLVLLGLTELENYESNLVQELKIDKTKSSEMAKRINDAVFSSVKDLLEIMNTPVKENSSTEKGKEIQKQEEEPAPVEDELDERFAGLSDGIRQIIIQSGYYTKLYKIAEENKLTVPQMGTLEEITTGVITNSIHPEDFEKMLVKNLGLPAGTVQKIVNEINEKILGPIREKMKEVYSRPESSAYEIKPQIKKNVLRVIRPTSEATDPILDTMELKEGNPAIDQKMQPVLGQKLADSYKASTVKTDHSIENMTKDKNVSSGAPKTYPPNADPYREIPE